MYSLEFQISHIPGDSVKNEIASLLGLPYSSDGKESTCNAGDSDSIPGSGRSSGEENGNPPPVFIPGESHGQGAWCSTVHGVAKSWT